MIVSEIGGGAEYLADDVESEFSGHKAEDKNVVMRVVIEQLINCKPMQTFLDSAIGWSTKKNRQKSVLASSNRCGMLPVELFVSIFGTCHRSGYCEGSAEQLAERLSWQVGAGMVRVSFMVLQRCCRDLLVGDVQTGRVMADGEVGLDCENRLRGGCRDQFAYGSERPLKLAAPVQPDERQESMLDLYLHRSRRTVVRPGTLHRRHVADVNPSPPLLGRIGSREAQMIRVASRTPMEITCRRHGKPGSRGLVAHFVDTRDPGADNGLVPLRGPRRPVASDDSEPDRRC